MWDIELTPMENFLQEERQILGDTFKGSKLLYHIKRAHILYDDHEIYLHALDRDIMNIYAHTFRHSFVQRKEWLLLYPAEKFALFALFALESLAVTSHIKKNQIRIHKQYKNRNRVLLISDDKSVRAEYINLNRKYEKVGLHYTYLRLGIVGLDKEVRPLLYGYEKKYPELIEPYFWISPSLDVFPKRELAKKLAVVIIDVKEFEEIEKIKEFRNWAVKHDIPMVLYVSRHLRSKPVIYLLQQKIPAWGWNDEIIRDRISRSLEKDESNAQRFYPTPFISTLPNMLNLVEGITHAVLPVNERKINQYLMELRKAAYQLKRTAPENSAAGKAARQIYSLIFSIEEMTAPLSYCEKYRRYCWGCLTLEQRVSFLSNLISRLRVEDRAAAGYLSGILVKFKELMDYMKDKRSGKPVIIEEVIKKTEKSGKRLAVVNRINAVKYALEGYLEAERGFTKDGLMESGISILTHSELMKAPGFDVILYYGVPPQYQLSILESSNSHTKAFLLYSSEQKIFAWLIEKNNLASDIFSYSSIVQNLSKITGINRPKIIRQIKNIEGHTPMARKKLIFIGSQDAETAAEESAEAIKIFPTDEYASLEEYISYGRNLDKEEEALMSVENAAGGVEMSAGVVSCMMLKLSEERKIFIPTYRQVPIYDMVREKVNYKPVSELSEGAVIILVDKSSARGLADAVISRVKSHPSMMKTVAYQQLWIEILKDEMAKRRQTNSDVSFLLGTRGCPRTPPAVYQWVNGHVIGPSEKIVITALGEIYRNQMLIDKADIIWAAINRLRSIHRTISHRLKYFATHYAVRGIEENELVDEELNLYLSDFKGIIDLEKVEDVKGPMEADSYHIDRILLEGFE